MVVDSAIDFVLESALRSKCGRSWKWRGRVGVCVCERESRVVKVAKFASRAVERMSTSGSQGTQSSNGVENRVLEKQRKSYCNIEPKASQELNVVGDHVKVCIDRLVSKAGCCRKAAMCISSRRHVRIHCGNDCGNRMLG